MRKKILIALAVLAVVIVVLCIFISLQPSTFAVERSATIPDSPAKVFVHLNDLKAWDSWSPWKELDPEAKMTISTPSAGKGATIAWNGNDNVGEGSMKILDSRPNELVELEQEFVRPMPGKARITFSLTPEGNGTRVTWKMVGEKNFVAKALCLFLDMDAMLGKEFERGLASLKGVVAKGIEEPSPSKP